MRRGEHGEGGTDPRRLEVDDVAALLDPTVGLRQPPPPQPHEIRDHHRGRAAGSRRAESVGPTCVSTRSLNARLFDHRVTRYTTQVNGGRSRSRLSRAETRNTPGTHHVHSHARGSRSHTRTEAPDLRRSAIPYRVSTKVCKKKKSVLCFSHRVARNRNV